MSNTFFGLSVDCADAATLAQFWADVSAANSPPIPAASPRSSPPTLRASTVPGWRFTAYRNPRP